MAPFELGKHVYSQMPAFHGADTAIGATVGGLVGAALPADNWKKRTRNALLGAGVGGLGTNLVGDRTRRYFSNIPDMTGYRPGDVAKTARKAGLKGVWEGAVLDKPMSSEEWGTPQLMRRELLRRGMSVHTDGPTDYFANIGRGPDEKGVDSQQVALKPRFMGTDPASQEAQRYMIGNGRGWSRVLAHYRQTPEGENGIRVRDTWDFDLQPAEKQRLRDLVFNPSAAKDLKSNMYYEGNAMRRPEEIASLLGRHLLNQYGLHRPAAINQVFQLPNDE